jgi:hypothetical protein
MMSSVIPSAAFLGGLLVGPLGGASVGPLTQQCPGGTVALAVLLLVEPYEE